ncbi:MAG: hypothetical protein R3C11_15685 [Planctomycetaceae bacterium]
MALGIMILLPKLENLQELLDKNVAFFHLSVSELDNCEVFDFSAQLYDKEGLILLERCVNTDDIFSDYFEWDNIPEEYLSLVLNLKTVLFLNYRGISRAKQILQFIRKELKEEAAFCLIDNDDYCLLKLVDVVNQIDKEPEWTWEKSRFDELPGAPKSDWED